MDPLHPIVPQRPHIPSVTPAPMTGRIDRDRNRAAADPERERRRRRRKGGPGSEYELEPGADDIDDQADGPHVDVTV
jgi:hypothetical protein